MTCPSIKGKIKKFELQKPLLKKQQQRNKFCRLCHLTRQERNVILSHEIGDLNCPSLSQRDLEGIKAKYSVNSAVPVDEEEDLVEKMAQLHGYDNEVNIDFAFKKDEIANTNKEHSPQTLHDNNIHVIQPVPSQIITVYQQDIPIHIDLDSGCWISTVRLDFAKKMKWNIHPNGQLAKIADGKTVLKAKGEIHEDSEQVIPVRQNHAGRGRSGRRPCRSGPGRDRTQPRHPRRYRR